MYVSWTWAMAKSGAMETAFIMSSTELSTLFIRRYIWNHRRQANRPHHSQREETMSSLINVERTWPRWRYESGLLGSKLMACLKSSKQPSSSSSWIFMDACLISALHETWYGRGRIISNRPHTYSSTGNHVPIVNVINGNTNSECMPLYWYHRMLRRHSSLTLREPFDLGAGRRWRVVAMPWLC